MPMSVHEIWYDQAGNLVEADDPNRYVAAFPYGSEVPADLVPAAYKPAAPTLTEVWPQTGDVGRTIELVLTGTNFSNNCSVLFGGEPTTGVKLVSPEELTLPVTASAAGSIPVQVTDNYGQSTQALPFMAVQSKKAHLQPAPQPEPQPAPQPEQQQLPQ